MRHNADYSLLAWGKLFDFADAQFSHPSNEVIIINLRKTVHTGVPNVVNAYQGRRLPLLPNI